MIKKTLKADVKSLSALKFSSYPESAQIVVTAEGYSKPVLIAQLPKVEAVAIHNAKMAVSGQAVLIQLVIDVWEPTLNPGDSFYTANYAGGLSLNS